MKEYKLPDNTYFTVRAYMIRDLHLKGNELLVYAIIDGFSHDGQSKFVGGISYLCAMTSSTKTNIIACLKNLREKGLIDRIEIKIGNIEKHSYFVTNVTRISGKQSKPEDEGSGKQSEHGAGLLSEHGAGKESKPIIEEKENNGSNSFQHPHPIFSPNNLKTDGIEKHPTELPKASTTSKPSGGGLNLKTSNIQSPHAPVDIAKVGRDMFELLRKKFPKDEMDNFLNSVDIDLPTLSNMFAEYWVFEKKRTFNKGESTGVFNSFRSWMSIAKGKEIPEKEVKVGLHTNPMLERLIPAIERKKIIKLTPQDANKVNAFIREFSPSNWALESGTKSFYDGNGKEWDHWIKAVKGAIEREKMGDI